MPERKTWYYYFISDLYDLSASIEDIILAPGVKISPNLRFKLNEDQSIIIDKGIKYSIEYAEPIISRGEVVPLPQAKKNIQVFFNPSRRVHISATQQTPDEYERAQPYHRLVR